MLCCDRAYAAPAVSFHGSFILLLLIIRWRREHFWHEDTSRSTTSVRKRPNRMARLIWPVSYSLTRAERKGEEDIPSRLSRHMTASTGNSYGLSRCTPSNDRKGASDLQDFHFDNIDVTGFGREDLYANGTIPNVDIGVNQPPSKFRNRDANWLGVRVR
ncbi:hypothetical protein BKA61DRAFT_686902 [Leptodontidium sp. MPI-SDFR-AT-0119]|nr:hypothetical protein BKA61DRAFT_686902 [Leptodontidium sp. MPI-SDFR-AT-0119]